MYNTALTITNRQSSSNNNLRQADNNLYGIVWDDDRHLNKSSMTEQPVMKENNSTNNSTLTEYIHLRNKDNDCQENKKVTIYMDKSLLEQMSTLKKNHIINTFSQLTSDAINEYMQNHSIE